MAKLNGKRLQAHLPDRALVRIAGDDATKFLQGILTCDVEKLAVGAAAFGALLTPQGKILFDFFLIRLGDCEYLADVASNLAQDFIKRLTFYRLRASVQFEQIDNLRVFAVWNSRPVPDDAVAVADPRHPDMGWRLYADRKPGGPTGDFHAHRIAVGMPEGGFDYTYGDTFPHEALMDQFHGVDFAKGCFVGQEVVSRMQHRGTARKRIVRVEAKRMLPAPGTEITGSGKPIGLLGSVDGYHGLAMLRLDRAAKAMAGGEPVRAGDVDLEPKLQSFVNFDWPGNSDERQSAQ